MASSARERETGRRPMKGELAYGAAVMAAALPTLLATAATESDSLWYPRWGNNRPSDEALLIGAIGGGVVLLAVIVLWTVVLRRARRKRWERQERAARESSAPRQAPEGSR
ncbi:hypothetical protein [Microbacterium petrolearium]